MNTNLSDQIYDNGILLGALLKITGLSIYEVQCIIKGDLILKSKNDYIKSLIMEGAEWRKLFCLKSFINNITIEDLNEAFGTMYSDVDYKSNIRNPNFYLNQFNFSLKDSNLIRKKLANILKNKYSFSQNQIADILDISPTTVGKIFGE